jgi:hypothetical protein
VILKQVFLKGWGVEVFWIIRLLSIPWEPFKVSQSLLVHWLAILKAMGFPEIKILYAVGITAESAKLLVSSLTKGKQRRHRHLCALTNSDYIPLRKFHMRRSFIGPINIEKRPMHLLEQIPNFFIAPLPILVWSKTKTGARAVYAILNKVPRQLL